jgi:hypothetical protein
MPTDLNTLAGSVLPQVKIYGSIFVSTITWLIFIGLFLVIAGIVTYIIYMKNKYNIKIIIFEKINGRWVDTKKDSATTIKFGDLGMNLLFTRKFKKYIPIPSKQSGIRKFYYRIRADGNWENFELNDDESPDKLRFSAVEKSITERNVGIRKGLGERYKTGNWIKENMVLIASVMFIVILGILMWLLFDKWIALANVTNTGVETSGKVMDKADAILTRLDNILTKTTSGVVPAITGVFWKWFQ